MVMVQQVLWLMQLIVLCNAYVHVVDVLSVVSPHYFSSRLLDSSKKLRIVCQHLVCMFLSFIHFILECILYH